ncbi:MAG: DUF2520 domain-containing protein [Parvularcula sp.]
MKTLLVGDGRVATALAAWLPVHGIDLVQWSRRAERAGECPPFSAPAEEAALVLIAIRDDAIKPFAEQYSQALAGKSLVHFSGALSIDGINAMHPLFAFPTAPPSLEVMDRIPFIGDEGGASFGDLFPDLPNPSFSIPASQRPLYHALAVLAGNFATYMWNRTATIMWDELSLPPTDVLVPYFSALVKNFEASPFDSLTGPVKRRDGETVRRNLEALGPHPDLHSFYTAFLDAAWPALEEPRSSD